VIAAIVAPREIQDRVKKLIDRDGVGHVAEKLGISKESVLRVASGMPVRAGTIALVEQKLGVDR